MMAKFMFAVTSVIATCALMYVKEGEINMIGITFLTGMFIGLCGMAFFTEVAQ